MLFCVSLCLKAICYQARQRAGRAGREGPGCCYRLFTEESFEGIHSET